MKHIPWKFTLLLYCILLKPIYSQEFTVMFWNVENLFHPENDSLTADDEFTPEGSRYWTYFRYREKLKNLSQALSSVEDWDFPAIIGLCEIENREVLYDLCHTTAFIRAGYNIVHEESNDTRGIDVALLYRPDSFKLRIVEKVSMRSAADSVKKGRDILYVQGSISSGKRIHIYVNHWPSKFGGVTETEEARCQAAMALRSHAEKYRSNDPDALVVIMGDLNDTVEDVSVSECLKAAYPGKEAGFADWYELIEPEKFPGTHKHGSEWSIIDHIIVSPAMYRYLKEGTASIHCPDFLLQPDAAYPGVKPLRTYEGFRYTGGFSDHLPVKACFRIP